MRILSLTALTLTLITGCTSSDAPYAKEDPVPLDAYPHIEAIGDAQDHVMAAQPIVTGGGSVPLSVSVPLRTNLKSRDCNIQYKFEFYDADGNLLQPDMAWMPKKLLPQSQERVSATAIDTTAIDWRLRIRDGR